MSEIDKEVMVENVLKNRYCLWVDSESQFVYEERSFKDKDLDNARFVCFKVKP